MQFGKIFNKNAVLVSAVAAVCVFLSGISGTAGARMIYVDDDGPADFKNIQAAINTAKDGDTVIVADGTYSGYGNRDIDFNGKSITVRSTTGPENCIIDCQGLGRAFHFHNGEQDSHLEGFTITNGYTESGGGALVGGISSLTTFTNCVFRGNSANRGGRFQARQLHLSTVQS